MSPWWLDLQHSPSSRSEAHRSSEMLHLDGGKGLREDVGGLLVRRAVDESNRAGLDRVADEMVPDVDMFGACVKFVVASKGDGTHVVGVNSHGFCQDFRRNEREGRRRR